MAPSALNSSDRSVANGTIRKGANLKVGNGGIEGLLKNEDMFQSPMNSEDYLDSLSPIIKDALRRKGLSDLIYSLNDLVKRKDEELDTVSFNSTDDINSCIDSIDNIHIGSQDLNTNLLRLNQVLSRSVHGLIAKKKSLIKSKEVTTKINETKGVLTTCIQVLEITNKIHDLIKQKNYFRALKLIDELTGIHLSKVEMFSFAVNIYDSIPHLTQMIRDEAFDNLSKWLSINLERKVQAIGEGLFDNLELLQKHWGNMKMGSIVLASQKINSPVEVAMRDPTLNYNIFADDSLQINLATLYDVILVYQTLKEDANLMNMYQKEWAKKYNRVIYPVTSSINSLNMQVHVSDTAAAHFKSLEMLNDYLKKICAFFVMDKQINVATKYCLRTDGNSTDLWSSYSTKLKPILLDFMSTRLANNEQVITFKTVIGNFLQIMENNGYDILDLYEVLMIVFRDHFGPSLIQLFRNEFLDSIQSDHYMPLVVQDRNDYENILKICWYKKDASFASQNITSMPVVFPFSEDYVHFCLGLRSLLEEILLFIGTHYSYHLNEINSLIVNDIFEKVLGEEKDIGISNDIQELISRNFNNKEVIAQSYTNLEYYLYGLYEMGLLINRRLRIHTGLGIHNIDTSGTFILKAIESFTNNRKFAEDTIFKMVDNKIRELLDMVEYHEWLPKEANDEANYSIKDFALFLENLFTSIFSNLPQSLRTLGLFRSYDFVAQHFQDILNNAETYNRVAIENFDLDVRYLEDSMSQLYTTQQNNQDEESGAVALESTFTELRQCINLLKLPNYDDFIKNPSFRMRKFDRIKYEDGLNLISKMQPDSSEENDTSFINDDSFSSNVSEDSQGQKLVSSSTASKLAKFSNKFKKKSEFDSL